MPRGVPATLKAKAGAAAPDVARSSTNLTDGAGAIAAAGVVTDQPWAQLAAAFTLTGIAGERLLVPALEWLGNDPPDRGFEQPVRLKRSHLRPSPALDVEDATVRHAVDAFEDINFAAAALRAMLRAAEREEAALDAGDDRAATHRHEEGSGYRVEAATGLAQVAGSYSGLAVDQKELASLYGERPEAQRRRRSSPAVRRILTDSRVSEPLATVHPPGPEWGGFSEAAEALLTAAQDCRELSEELGRWEAIA